MYSVLDLNTYNFTVIGNSKEKETDNKMNKTRIPRFLKYTVGVGFYAILDKTGSR